jgi:hypothetical protein
VIYLSSVLVMTALLTVPIQTWLKAIVCICVEGIAGLGYSVSLAIRRDAYQERSDLFPYVVLPFVAYALMVAGGLLLLARPRISLDLVAAGMLVLLCLGSETHGRSQPQSCRRGTEIGRLTQSAFALKFPSTPL